MGEVPQAEGFGKDQRRCFANLRRKAASRLWVNPFGSQARHFPYIAGGAATQRKTLLRFWLLIMMHSSLHRAIAYIALTLRHRGRHSLVAVCGLGFMVELHITVRFPVSQLSSLNPQLNKAALRRTAAIFHSAFRN